MIRTNTWVGCLGALALLAVAGAALAQTASEGPAATPPAAQTLGLAQDASSRLTVKVLINGRGPYSFLVDTGSNNTVISRELAETLGLPAGRGVVIHETAGADPVRTVMIDKLTIGERVVSHILAPALSARDIGADGMLGVDALRDLHIVMDFKALSLTTSPSHAEPIDERTIVVRGRSRFGELILANSRIHGAPVLVVLDSGAQVSVGNPALLSLLTGHSTSTAPRQTTTLVTVTGRRLVVEVDVISEAQVGGVRIRNMPLAFSQLHIFNRFGLTRQPALLLGMDVLSLCQKVTVDLRRREATFTLNPAV